MEIQLYTKLTDPIAAIKAIGLVISKSGFAKCERLEQGEAIALICLSDGISLTQYLRTYDLIDGKPRKKAMAALAEFRALGGKYKWIKTGTEASKEFENEAVCEFEFEGSKLTVKFSMEDARRAGLIRPKSNWEKQPANQLRARVASNAIGMLAPEIYAGDAGEDDAQPVAKEITLNVNPTDARFAGSEIIVEQPKNHATIASISGKSIPCAETVIDAEAEISPLPFTISEELANQAVAAVGEHLVDVLDWMIEQDEKEKSKSKPGWISREQAKSNPENPFRFLTAFRARQVISSATQCLGVVKQWKESKGKA